MSNPKVNVMDTRLSHDAGTKVAMVAMCIEIGLPALIALIVFSQLVELTSMHTPRLRFIAAQIELDELVLLHG
ncbi:unnamed protein product [Victoria cruziana]